VRALRNLHAALVPDGLVVDTQPVSAHPRVTSDGVVLGALDMREWEGILRAVDGRVDETFAEGLFAVEHEEWFVVDDVFTDGPECAATVGAWRGTTIPPELASKLAACPRPVAVSQDVRLRLLRRRHNS